MYEPKVRLFYVNYDEYTLILGDIYTIEGIAIFSPIRACHDMKRPYNKYVLYQIKLISYFLVLCILVFHLLYHYYSHMVWTSISSDITRICVTQTEDVIKTYFF